MPSAASDELVTPGQFMEFCSEASEGHPDGLRALLARVDAKSLRIGGSARALQAAVSVGSARGVQLVLEALAKQTVCEAQLAETDSKLPLPGLHDLDSQGFSPLHTAAELGYAGCAAALLEGRADPLLRTADAGYQLGQTSKIYNEGGRTALHIAAQQGSAEVARELLAVGGRGLTEACNSFGLRPCDVAEEQLCVATTEASKAKHRELLELLGAKLIGLSAEEARERRQGREAELRRRVTAAEKQAQLDARRAMLEAVRERYTPLDEAVARGKLPPSTTGCDVVVWQDGSKADLESYSFTRQPAVTHSRETGAEEPFPGVFVFRLLSTEFCSKIWAETEHYLMRAEGQRLPLPMRHDGGLDLSRVFPELLERVVEAAAPAVHALLSPELHDVELEHAFRTKNFVGRDESFKRHVDQYAVTLNVCLRKTADVKGSRVFFYESDTVAEPAYAHEHEVGLAVLHSSKEWHQTEQLFAGERGSMIMWYSHKA